MIPPIETLYFDASDSFISPILSIKSKDGSTKRILICAPIIKHPIGKSPPIAFFEYITSDHNIVSIRQSFLKFKEMERMLFGCCKTLTRVVADFSKAIRQALLQEYAALLRKMEKYVCIFVHSAF